MILIDTSVIADIFTKDPDWFEWSSGQIEHWAEEGPLCYNAINFAELVVKFDTQRDLRTAFRRLPHCPSHQTPLSKPAKLSRNIGARAARRLARCPTSSSTRTPMWRTCLCSRATRAVCARSFLPYG